MRLPKGDPVAFCKAWAAQKYDPVAFCKAWRAENEPVFHVRAAADGRDVEISIMDVIGEDYWSGGITAKTVKYALDANKNAKNIKVLINSPGGDSAEGMGIYNLLRAHAAQVRTEVVGLAASAASWVMQAGDTRIIHQPSMVMIHGAWMVTKGNAEDHKKSAEILDKLNGEQVDLFAKRTGLGKDELAAMIAAETWMGAEECCTSGFADMLAEDDPNHPDNAGADDDDAAARARIPVPGTPTADVLRALGSTEPLTRIEQERAFDVRVSESPMGSAVKRAPASGGFQI